MWLGRFVTALQTDGQEEEERRSPQTRRDEGVVVVVAVVIITRRTQPHNFIPTQQQRKREREREREKKEEEKKLFSSILFTFFPISPSCFVVVGKNVLRCYSQQASQPASLVVACLSYYNLLDEQSWMEASCLEAVLQQSRAEQAVINQKAWHFKVMLAQSVS